MAYKDPEKAKAWREANKVRLAEKKREWYEANRDALIARSLARSLADKVKEARRLAYAAKRDAAGLPCRKPKGPPKARTRVYSEDQLNALKAARAAWKSANKCRVTESTSRRRAIKISATPSWSSARECAEVYAMASAISASTGIQHQVDHIVPLRSSRVCGLHVPSNLQVLPAVENIVKGNRTWPDMP